MTVEPLEVIWNSVENRGNSWHRWDTIVLVDSTHVPRFGDIYWIDDGRTGLGKERHPWIIVEDYDSISPTVKACIRSTTGRGSVEIPCTYQGQQVDHFNQDGRVNPKYRKTLPIQDVLDSRYGGELPRDLGELLKRSLRGGS
jgi:mRNA-degrading endonuclease toxin of MazEF toxin-antitoxin module